MIDLPTLLAAAARLFDVSDGALRDGRGRQARLVQARQAVAWVLRCRQYTMVEIGALLHRDHSTICYACAQAEARIGRDAEYAHRCAALLAALDEPPPTAAATVALRGNSRPLAPGVRVALAWWGILRPSAA